VVDTSAAFSPLDLLLKLVLTILLPLLAGKAGREAVPRARALAGRHRMALKYASSALLISVPWVTMSKSADKLRAMSAAAFCALVAVGAALHLLLLALNYAASGLLRIPLPERKAVVINASQKTVNTAMSVVQFLPPSLGDTGLLVLPCVVSHLVQVLLDAALVARWRRTDDAGSGGAGGDAGGDARAGVGTKEAVELVALPAAPADAEAACTSVSIATAPDPSSPAERDGAALVKHAAHVGGGWDDAPLVLPGATGGEPGSSSPARR
jgi:hypothetical protein